MASEIISPEDLATATILGEAEGEGLKGMLCVAKVIRNRMRERFFSDGTLAGTVLKPFQFSIWNTNELRRIAMCQVDKYTEHAIQARQAWQESAEWAGLPDSVVMYHASTMKVFPEWARPGKGFKKVVELGRHIFYAQEG